MKYTPLAAFLVVLTVLGAGQIPNNTTVAEPDPPETTKCGDGVCAPIEEGICPADCGSQEEQSQEQSSPTQDDDGSESSEPVFDRIYLLGGAAAVLIVILLGFLALRMRGGRDDEDNSDIEEVKRYVRKRVRSGASVEKIESELRSRNFEEDVVLEALDDVELD